MRLPIFYDCRPDANQFLVDIWDDGLRATGGDLILENLAIDYPLYSKVLSMAVLLP
jgi:hypothetical protein